MCEVIEVKEVTASGDVSSVHNNGLLCMFARDDGVNYIAKNIDSNFTVAMKGTAEEPTDYVCTLESVWQLKVTDSDGREIMSNSDTYSDVISTVMAALDTKYKAPVLNITIEDLNSEFLGKSLSLSYLQKAFDNTEPVVLISLKSTGAYIICEGNEWRKYNAVGVLQVFGYIRTTAEDVKRQMEAGAYDDDLIVSYSTYSILARARALEIYK